MNSDKEISDAIDAFNAGRFARIPPRETATVSAPA
ncbi:MAG: hypothetical protein EPN72_05630 [Nevskiaceae bacterium]|nr:MAG: hypothetical protein EPN63_03565 [Nevskiaceae bacterium]TBR73616.1 MAG: hypothetical protein EPN72_05630 [Nevskiaceae bacterium]